MPVSVQNDQKFRLIRKRNSINRCQMEVLAERNHFDRTRSVFTNHFHENFWISKICDHSDRIITIPKAWVQGCSPDRINKTGVIGAADGRFVVTVEGHDSWRHPFLEVDFLER